MIEACDHLTRGVYKPSYSSNPPRPLGHERADPRDELLSTVPVTVNCQLLICKTEPLSLSLPTLAPRQSLARFREKVVDFPLL